MVNLLVDGNILIIDTAVALHLAGTPNKSWVSISFTEDSVEIFDNATERNPLKKNPWRIPFDEFSYAGTPQNTAPLILAALKDVIGQ
jgi:hypothetical protein